MRISKIVSASLALMLGWSGTAFAQSEMDALRYSRLGITGSARIQGIGGAQTALGADISTLSANPAGLGMFRRSEVSITPGFGIQRSSAFLDNITTSDEVNRLSIPHAGIVFSNRKGDNEGGDWRGASFGLSYTQLNNFNSRTTYNGLRGGDESTIVEYFAEQANLYNRTLEELNAEIRDGYTSLEGMAFGTYLIDVVEDENGQQTAVAMERLGNINQQEELWRRGSQNQIDFGVGTSYRDKVYLGASLGIVTSNFTQERLFREMENSSETAFTGLELRDEYRSRGTGLNLKVGVIFRPVDAIRLGATIQTPTAYTFVENYNSSLSASFDDGPTERAVELPGDYSYALTTPFRATGGIAFFINKYGFVTADLEYVNYANARFAAAEGGMGTSGSFFGNLNSGVQSNFQSAVNFKIGAEGRYEVFRFRAGFNSSADPYTSNSSGESRISTFTLGSGIRLQNYYVDVAYLNSGTTNYYSPYVFSDGMGPVVDINDRMSNVMFTVGYNF